MDTDNDPLRWLDPFRGLLAVDPGVFALSATVFLFNASIHVIGWYVPQYLFILGARPEIIGLYGSVGILSNTLYLYVSSRVPDQINSRIVLTAVGVLSSFGFFLWLAAPQLRFTFIGITVPAWVWIFAGLPLVQAWRSFGLKATSPVIARSSTLKCFLDDFATVETIRRVGFLVGFLVVVGLLATTVKFIPGFQILLALTASTSLMITVIQHVLGEGNSSVTGEQIVSSAHVLLPICSRPSNRRLLVGDALIRFANGMVSIFFVLIVTDILRIDATIFDHHLEPTAFFGVLLAIETFIVALSLRPGAEIARRAGPIPIAVASILITALFPLFYITIPANPAVVGLLFAFSGLRFAGIPARKALIADQITSAHSRTVDSYYLVRETVAVPSALIGGWLYGINPKLAFGLATVIGLLGVLEFLRFVAQIGWSDSEQ